MISRMQERVITDESPIERRETVVGGRDEIIPLPQEPTNYGLWTLVIGLVFLALVLVFKFLKWQAEQAHRH